jgi:hypothetical protein
MESPSITFDTKRVLALDQMLLSLGPGHVYLEGTTVSPSRCEEFLAPDNDATWAEVGNRDSPTTKAEHPPPPTSQLRKNFQFRLPLELRINIQEHHHQNFKISSRQNLCIKQPLGLPNASTRCPNTNSFSSKRTAVACSTHFLVPKNLL